MDQKDAAVGLALRYGQRSLDGPAIGELGFNVL
jgi:hypothetical protein